MDIEKKRRRIALVAALNGWSIAVFAALCLLCSLLWFTLSGILIGLALMTSACMELSGRRRLKQNRPEARRWLAGSQLLLLTAIVLYSAYNLLVFDPHEIMREVQEMISELKEMMKNMSPELRASLSQVIDLLQRMDPKELEEQITMAFRTLYRSLIAATVLYQGGLWLYYTLATRKLDRAAAEPQGKL
jgi:predicted PurR-regulated permease PerM